MLRGRFDDTSGAPYIEGRLILPRFELHADVSFLMDTGADRTVVMQADARRIGLNYSSLTGESESLGLGGICSTFTEPALVVFSEPGKTLYAYDIQLVIPAPTPDTQSLPSLLGRDILNRWSIAYNPSRDRLSIRVVSADVTVPIPR